MSDTQAAMREFRFLDEKRKTSGLLPPEEQRWQELAAHLGIDISQAVGGYWGADGQWYAYPQQPGYDPNAYTQPGQDPNYGYYDPNQYPQDPQQQQQQQQAYDPNYGYYDPNQYPQQQEPQAGWDPNAYPQQQQQQQQPYADPYAQQQQQPQQGAWPQDPEQWQQQTTPGYPAWEQQATAPMPAQEPMPEPSWQQPAPPPSEPAPVPSGEESSGPMEVSDDEVMEVTDDDVQLLDSTPAPEVVVPKRAPIMGKPFKPVFGSPEKPLTEKRLVPAPPAPAMPQRPFAPLPPAPVPDAPVAQAPALDLVADLRTSLEESQPLAKPAFVEPPPPAPPPPEPPPPPPPPPPAALPPPEPVPEPVPEPPPPPAPVLETRVAVPVEEPKVEPPPSTEVSIDVDEPEPPPPPPPPAPAPPPEPEPEPSVVVAEEPPPQPPTRPPSPEPSVIVAEEPPPQPPTRPPSPEPVIEPEVSPVIKASPVVEAEPSIVVSPELGPAVTLPPEPEPEVGHFAQPPPPRPMDFDVEVDAVAPAQLAPPPLELSGAADDRVELAATADFLDYSKHQAPPPVPDEMPLEAPVFQSATLAQLANEDALSAAEEPTSPSEAPLALATNADFLAQPELVNTGEAWQRSGPAALELETNESTDVHFDIPAPQGVPLGSEPDDDTDIITGVVIDEEEEPTVGQGVPSQEMFAAESTVPEIPVVPPAPPPPPSPVRAPPPPPSPPPAPPAPPPPRAVANPIPPEGPYRPPSNVPGPPVAVGAGNFERTGAPLQPDQEHIVVKGEHRVILHTLEGQVKRGAIKEADLAGEHVLLDSGAAGGKPERIPRVRVKAIFFMLPAGTKAPTPDGQKVRVTFKDGRQVAGFSKDHKAGGQGFFVVPADNRTNTSRIFIYRHSVQAIAVD